MSLKRAYDQVSSNAEQDGDDTDVDEEGGVKKETVNANKVNKRPPKLLSYVKGDILNATETYIVHQCNCVGKKGHGLSTTMFRRFPYADIYNERLRNGGDDKAKVGSIILRGNGKDQRYVVNLLGQLYPGAAKYNNDSAVRRAGWFKQALSQLARTMGQTDSIAFPYKIGCGLGGGDWVQYEKMLEEFASSISGKVVIYELP